MTSTKSPPPEADDPSHRDQSVVAKSAGLAFLGRLGALIEAVSFPVFAYLYGAEAVGVYVTLWGYIMATTAVTDYAMTTTLQRFVPAAKTEEEAHSAVKIALIVSTGLGLALAMILYFLAPYIAGFINAGPAEEEKLSTIIRLYVWSLPLWTFVESATATVRARRTFGPEIRIRIFYEQGLRLAAGVGFFYLGYTLYGLYLAHIFSQGAAAVLSILLVAKYYDLKAILFAPLDRKLLREMLSFATPMTPANFLKKLNIQLPVIMLNTFFPGAAGAQAAALFAAARKIASVLRVIRLSFDYVLAPLAAEKSAKSGHASLADMYSFATRLMIATIIPAAVILILIRESLLDLAFEPQFMAAAGALLVLSVGRILEAALGPASTLIEMLGNRMIPLINGTIGVTVMTSLLFLLGPAYGATGAAFAASAGLFASGLADLWQAHRIFGLVPYRRSLLRPAFVAILASAASAALIYAATPFGPAAVLAVGIASLIASYALICRYGLNAADAKALGPFGRFARKP